MRRIKVSASEKSRFILARQGLLSASREWSGKKGVRRAIEAMALLQVDWVRILAPSHHLVLLTRVDGYQSKFLDDMIYGEKRTFIEYGGVVFIQPIENLPFLRLKMEEKRRESRWVDFAKVNRRVIDSVRDLIRERGSIRKRDVCGAYTQNYRGRNEAAVALYYLWLIGELLIKSRTGNEIIYAPFDAVAPPELRYAADPAEALRALACQRIAALGTCAWPDPRTASTATELVAEGVLAEIDVIGQKTHFILANDLPYLDKVLSSMRRSKRRTAYARLLSPLDMVVARGRASEIFSKEFIWEIYKKPENRRYGPYAMPVLVDGRMVGRLDARIARKERALFINGFWQESDANITGSEAHAIALEIARLARFLGAESVVGASHLPHYRSAEIRRLLTSQ